MMCARHASTRQEEPVPDAAARLLPALRRLDQVLVHAVRAAEAVYGCTMGSDPFRGLHITGDEVERLLWREPGMPLLWNEEEGTDPHCPAEINPGSPLHTLAHTFGLAPFELDVLLIALAPELDLKYERLYAYLQDDVSRRRPSVDLALNLLCPTAEEKLARRSHFAPDAPLIRQGLLQLAADPNQIQPPLLAHILKLDEQIVSFLLGQRGLDARLAPFCRLVEPVAHQDSLLLAAATTRSLLALVAAARQSRRPLRVYFAGARGTAATQLAEMLAARAGMPLLVAELQRTPDPRAIVEVAPLLLRDTVLRDAALCLEGLDRLWGEEWAAPRRQLLDLLSEAPGLIILAGSRPWPDAGHSAIGAISVALERPGFEQRRAAWAVSLGAAGVNAGMDDLAALAGRFRLFPGQITGAVADACSQARLRGAGVSTNGRGPTLDDLQRAACARSGHALAVLARKVEPVHSWDDLVLPDDSAAQLRDICLRVVHREQVLGGWGFGRKLALGRGVSALFAGPSGTGKTMAAAIIAGALGLDVYKIDLASVVSKYIGETEKNLERIFAAAEDASAILFFDEADALFGKRSEVRDAHDRYANIEIAYLLQRMEEYDGVTILATNLRQNMDEAFLRRLAFIVPFPFPDEASRRRIWEQIWPDRQLLAADVDLVWLARQFKLSGGNIRNIALAAAFLAAERGGPIMMDDLLQATLREHQKLGKVLSATELNGIGRNAEAPA